MSFTEPSGNMGPATDRHNEPVVDPTKNVLDLVGAAISRQDDLRSTATDHITELLKVQSGHTKELLNLHADHQRQMATKESDRLDAIRAVDRDAVTRAAEVSATQANTLAVQVAASAEALRNQVETSRVATETRLASSLAPITESIELLRAAQYAQQGERAARVETREQGNWSIGLVVTIVAVVFSVILGIVGIYVGLSRGGGGSSSNVPSCSAASVGQTCLTVK